MAARDYGGIGQSGDGSPAQPDGQNRYVYLLSVIGAMAACCGVTTPASSPGR
jgi:hypothetical protein